VSIVIFNFVAMTFVFIIAAAINFIFIEKGL